jgi:hypothetical protein
MNRKLLTALAIPLALLPAAAAFAGEGGGAYILASRFFPENDPQVFGPYRMEYRNSANTEVQAQLARLGFYHGPIDGNVAPGSPTALAIAKYQQARKLPVTGAINGGLIADLSRF